MMALNALPLTTAKQRRIMILTVDEELINQIEKSNDSSLLTKIVLESETNMSQNSEPKSIFSRVASEKTCSPNKSTTRGKLTCVVCQASANGYKFGAIACESCKAFFRRNATKDLTKFQCRFKRNCEINSDMRRYCPACRLAKCFDKGMQRDRILTDEQKLAKRRKLEENRTLAWSATSKVNEQQFQSLLPELYSDELVPMDTNILFLTDFAEYLSTEPKQVFLTPDELQRIENISLAYQKRLEFATHDIPRLGPSTQTASFSQILNRHSVEILRLLSFFKQLPEFNQLNIDDKVTLVKHNLIPVVGISAVLLYRAETQQIMESDSDIPANAQAFQLVFGHKICSQLDKSFQSLLRIAKYDAKIIQLALIALILTKSHSIPNSSEPILHDVLGVYRVQNSCIELLWKYMEATCGFEVAVRLFTELIVHTIPWQTLQEDMRESILRTLSPQDIDDLLPIVKAVWIRQ